MYVFKFSITKWNVWSPIIMETNSVMSGTVLKNVYCLTCDMHVMKFPRPHLTGNSTYSVKKNGKNVAEN